MPGIRIGFWRVDGARRPGHASDTYPVVLDAGTERAELTVFDAPALQLGSYPRRIVEIADVLKTVEHPGVVNVLNAGLLADGRPYVVTDVDAGVTLPEIVPAGTCIDPVPAVTILRGVCAPLIAAHDIGVVHGALDLENVFLVEDDEHYIRLLDWGIERAVFDEARRAGIECPPRVTCVAPEEALGVRSPQTDAYALGVLAYRLLLGRSPFDAETTAALRAMQAVTRPDPRELWPTIPAALETLLCELLAPDPRSRPSIRRVSERLAALTQELEPSHAAVLALPADEPAPVEQASDETAHDTGAETTDVAPPVDNQDDYDHYDDYSVYDDYNVYDDCDDYVVTIVPRRRALRWGAGMAACGAVLAAVIVSAVRTSDAPTAHRPARPHAAAPSTAASVAPVHVHPAVPPTFQPAPPRTTSRPAPPTSQPAAPAPMAKPVAAAPVIVESKPQATPPPAMVAARASRPAERVHAVEHTAPVSDVDARNELLTDYQRVGRALFELRRQRGEEATSELWQEFRALKIEPALATARSRAAAEATLRELQARVERQRGVEISEACLNNPLADGCR